jgi:hypothetical protein
MFVPRIIRRSRNYQQYALICITTLFYILALHVSAVACHHQSFLDPCELLEIQIEWVVYHITCGYVVCVGLSWFRLLCFPAGKNKRRSHDNQCILLVISTTLNTVCVRISFVVSVTFRCVSSIAGWLLITVNTTNYILYIQGYS